MALILLLQFFKFTKSYEPFPICNILRGDWNAEIIDMKMEGKEIQRSVFSFSVIPLIKDKFLKLNIFEGEFPIIETGKNDTRTPIFEYAFNVTSVQGGFLQEIEPDGVKFATIELIDTFSAYLGAYGVFNDSFKYAMNIVNLATIHISLYSFEDNIFQEVILTRTKTGSDEPWYWKYNKYIIGIGAFVGSFIFLKVTERLTFNAAKDKAKEEKSKGKKKNKIKNE